MGQVVNIAEASEYSRRHGNIKLNFRCENDKCKVPITGAAYIPGGKKYDVTAYFSRQSAHVDGCEWEIRERKAKDDVEPLTGRDPKTKSTPTHVSIDLFDVKALGASRMQSDSPITVDHDQDVVAPNSAGLHIRNLDELVTHYEECSPTERQNQMDVRIIGLSSGRASWDSLFRSSSQPPLGSKSLVITYGVAKIERRYGMGASFDFETNCNVDGRSVPVRVYLTSSVLRDCPWGKEMLRLIELAQKEATPLTVYWIVGKRTIGKKVNTDIESGRAFTLRLASDTTQ
jgi:hypothetical protein